MITNRCARTLRRRKFVPGIRYLSHFHVVEHTVPTSYVRTYPGAIEPGTDGALRLAVKQYIPHLQPQLRHEHDAVTIIGGHANGFPKELYEPLWDDLYESLTSRGQSIRSIWIADVAQQGASGRLNETVLGNDPNWWDHARDLLFLINQQQRQMPQPLIGIGHSMGGSILAALSLLHPSLLQSLVLIDPVIQTENPSKGFVAPSTYRRDRWPSSTTAMEAFQRSRFYQSWDSRVLQKWLNYGLLIDPQDMMQNKTDYTIDMQASLSRDAALHDDYDANMLSSAGSADAEVILSTTKAQEVFHYLRPLYKAQGASNDLQRRVYPDINPDDLEPGYEFYRPEPADIFRQLPQLKPTVLYCFGELSPLATPALRQKKMATTGTGYGGSGGAGEGYVKEALFDTGHMIPFENPRLCAQASADWIVTEMERWKNCASEWRQIWSSMTAKRDIDDEWLKRIPRPQKSSKPG